MAVDVSCEATKIQQNSLTGLFDAYLDHVLLNQPRTGLWPAHAWFPKIDPVQIISMCVCVCVCVCVCLCVCVCMCVYVSTPEAINN